VRRRSLRLVFGTQIATAHPSRKSRGLESCTPKPRCICPRSWSISGGLGRSSSCAASAFKCGHGVWFGALCLAGRLSQSVASRFPRLKSQREREMQARGTAFMGIETEPAPGCSLVVWIRTRPERACTLGLLPRRQSASEPNHRRLESG